MRDYLKQEGRAFPPETVQLLVEAFDAAWAVVRNYDGIGDGAREAIRATLARRTVETWDHSRDDVRALRDAVLRSFDLPPPGA